MSYIHVLTITNNVEATAAAEVSVEGVGEEAYISGTDADYM